MTTKPKKPSRLTKALLETAREMHRSGVFNTDAYKKITIRHVDRNAATANRSLSPAEIRMLRERAQMSQAVFARHLNVTAGYVSQLERRAKRPIGTALVLLNVIRRKGIEAIL